jgi:UDP-glucose 4-epimerase
VVTTFLVTGGAGFIGSHVCDRLLAEGHRVIAVDDLTTGRIANLVEARGYGKEFTFFNMDVRAEGLLPLFERHRPEVVMHLAAQAGVRPSLEDPVHDASVNIMGLLNVLECCVKTGVRKVVYAASGGTIYGEPKKIPVKESAAGQARPQSPYGVSKKVGVDYLAFYERYRGLDFTAVALANVYGPRQDPTGEAGVVAIFAAKMLAGEQPTIFGDGNQTRDYVFVDDTVHAFALAAERGSGRMVNIGTGIETSVNALFKMMAGITGFSGQPATAPVPPGELRRIALDCSSAAQVLGWKPWTHLEDGLGETVAFIKGI